MKNEDNKRLLLQIFSLMVIVAAVFVFNGINNQQVAENERSNDGVKRVQAQSASVSLSGWAWSDNIGWLSFSCENMSNCTESNYGVKIDSSTGKLSGYAWSENIGWVSFNESDLNGCPTGVCVAQLNGSQLEGWARALAGTDASDGWDGWIHLSGSNHGATLQGDNTFNGFAWGSTVVGWLSFSCEDTGDCGTADYSVEVGANNPTADMNATPSEIDMGSKSEIEWDSQDTVQCTGTCTGDSDCSFTTGGSTSGSTDTVSLEEDTTYSISCNNGFGDTVNASVLVDVREPELNISADPETVREAQTTTIEWSAENVEYCEVDGPNGVIDSDSGSSLSSTHTVETQEIEGQSTYTLSCDLAGDGGTVSESVTVRRVPDWEEF